MANYSLAIMVDAITPGEVAEAVLHAAGTGDLV